MQGYKPASGRSQPIAPLNRARFKFPHAIAIAANGQVIVAGGERRIEIYDDSANRFAASGGGIADEWFYATATPLADGRGLIAYNDDLYPTKQTWIYQPSGAPVQKLAWSTAHTVSLELPIVS